MGVQGLWELLTPVGRRVSVDALGSRKLAIDASIWIIQFMKAMRDDKGDMVRNAHLLGFFRRICKLLFLRIKPVFVFDGATPALKRRTVLARRRQREKAQSKIRKTAEKLLLNHLRTRKLEEIASEINLGPQSIKTKTNDEAEKAPVIDARLQGQAKADAQFDLSPSDDKYDQEGTDALLAASLAAELGDDLKGDGKSAVRSDEGSDDDDDDDEEQLILPVGKNVDPSVLASLPPSLQLDLLVQMREQLVAENRQKFQKVAKVPSSFSQMQIQAYLKTVAFRREITEVQKAAAGGGIGGVPTARIASTTDREFIFSKSYEGEKPAPSEIEKRRRSDQTTSPKAVHPQLSKSLIMPSSSLFSSIKSNLEKETPEEGVISLVSTESNQENDSNSIVHTYIDERGHVRVNRRRGMGVRMTRDLQWNLYLIKDVEARKLAEKASVAIDPAVVPSSSSGNTALSTANALQNSYSVEQGLQISFVDDGVSEVSKGEDGDLFEELVMEEEDRKDDQASAIHDPKLFQDDAHQVNVGTGLTNVEDEVEDEWEDGGVEESRDGSVVEDRDLAEALRLSLLDQHPVQNMEPRSQILLEDGPSSEESEVEWEDGTGDVSVTGLDDPILKEEVTGVTLMPSEEAEFEEAIRRSLEDFHAPAKASSQLVIKEPADNSSNTALHGLKALSNHSPSVRAEAESEELYLARERTRKGKAVLGGDGEGSFCTAVTRPQMPISEQEQIAALTLSEMPVIEATMQGPPRLIGNSCDRLDPAVPQRGIDFRSISIPIMADISSGNSQRVSDNMQVGHNSVDSVISSSVKGDRKDARSSRLDVGVVVGNGRGINEHSLQADEAHSENPARISAGLRNQVTQPTTSPGTMRGQVDHKGLSSDVDEHFVEKPALNPSQSLSMAKDDQADLLREAEGINIAMEREELQRREAVIAERENLAREEAELQVELEAEQEDIQAGLDRERELLAQEELELRATQKRNERNADSVTGEMFTEVQELLQMFGLPYIIAPMEAEAQCAFMDTIQLVDGVVTDDSDVFLFGGRSVYKNLFDDRKYVETYYMKDLESEMGMNREKLIRIAMLLGSDYTEGISGIGIVNAIEVVNAFPEEDGLKKFKEWLDSPDHALFAKAQGHPKGKGKGSGKGESTRVDETLDEDEPLEAGGFGDLETEKFTARQQIFMSKHRAVSKNWNIPDSFPSEAVVSAYMNPAVDKSTETFSWGRPDLEALRRFCFERFAWNKQKADELLLPVLKEYDRRETQTRLESFYHFNQRFAKIRSRRIQKAVTGMTGKRSAELMELPPHLVIQSPPKKSQKKSNLPNLSESPLVHNEAADVSGNHRSSSQDDPYPDVGNRSRGAGQGGRGRARRGRRQHHLDMQSAEGLAGNVENANVGNGAVSIRGRRGRVRGGGRGRGRAWGRNQVAKEQEEASISGSSDSDDAMGENLGGIDSLKRKANEVQQCRRSTRQRSQVNYHVDDSDEEAGGTCSDGEEMFKEVDLLIAEATRKVLPSMVRNLSNGAGATETIRLEKSSGEFDGAGPSETREYETGGGFCGSDEDDPGQQDTEIREPEYFATGGGFCLAEDQDDQPSNPSDVLRDSLQSQQHDAFREAFHEERDVLDQNVYHQPQNDNTSLGRSVRPYSDGSGEFGRIPSMPDTSMGINLIPTVSQGSELGLRAMPFMRRKNRKSI